jgi:hypothetical protein
MPEIGAGCLVGFALWDQEIAGVSGADFDNIGFGTEALNLFFEDDLCVGHNRVG